MKEKYSIGKLSENGKEIILEKQENGCVKCLSHCTDKDGYVRINYNRKQDRLFRVLYEQNNEKIPKGMVLRHLCNNAWCVNVEHLKVGTQKENYQDMVDCGRSPKGRKNFKISGEKNKNHKLTEEQVKTIYLSKLKYRELAEIYNVSETTINDIKNKKWWKWLTDTLD